MTFKATALTIFICVLFGGNPVSIKLSLAGFGTFTTAAIRFGVATLVIIFWARIKKIPLKLNLKQTKQTLILAAIFVIQLSFFYHGLERTTASHGILIANLLPFFVLFRCFYVIVYGIRRKTEIPKVDDCRNLRHMRSPSFKIKNQSE